MEKCGRFSKLEVGEAKPEKKASADIFEEERGADYYKEAARQCYYEGDYEGGLRYYSRVLEFDCNELESWLGQVRCLVELDELKEADTWCGKALERFVDNPELLATKAIVHSRMGDFTRAKAYSDTSLEKETSSPYVWLARGEVFLASRGRNAEYCFHKGITENPKDWFLYFGIAKICMYYTKISLASKYFVRALELNTSSPFLYLQAGKCYQALGVYKSAYSCYKQALVLKPNYSEADGAFRNLTSRGFFDRLFRRG